MNTTSEIVERSFFNADDLSLLIMEHPDAPQFLAVKIADEHDAAMAQSLEATADALLAVSIGGNHVALLIGSRHPLYTASDEEASAHYGKDLDGLNAWHCWRAIMKATREVYDALPEVVRNDAWKRMEQRRARAALAGSGEK
jgi:hypothetical protein